MALEILVQLGIPRRANDGGEVRRVRHAVVVEGVEGKEGGKERKEGRQTVGDEEVARGVNVDVLGVPGVDVGEGVVVCCSVGDN